VYGIVLQAKGWIDVRSEPGDGATFNVYFPLADDHLVEARAEPVRVAANRAAAILLVEDQPAARLLFENFLSEAGHRVMSAGSGRAALDLAIHYKDPIDLLVTDVIMPEMNGPELADQLKRLQPGLIVVFMSGYPDDALSRQVFEDGTVFLQKPFLPETLLGTVDELIRKNSVRVAANG
jgi:two-component system cell cycle sensor histidine kinase/response regulator CckA